MLKQQEMVSQVLQQCVMTTFIQKKKGSWKFLKRTINFFYYVKTEDYLDSLNDPMRVNMGEGKIAADIPESIPSWIEFQRKNKS